MVPQAALRMAATSDKGPVIKSVSARAYRSPTTSPESDGTAEWTSTTTVTVRVQAGGCEGFGYTYASASAVEVISDTLYPAIQNMNAFDIPHAWQAMRIAVRNMGQPGIAATAISAVDNALWDLKAQLLGVPLIQFLGAAREKIEVYGSGGFTTYGPEEITRQIAGWRAQGIRKFKIKIGRDREQDGPRILAGLHALPLNGELFVDANGAYHPQEALKVAQGFANTPVTWFEEPVSSDDIEGLVYVHERSPPGLHIAAGEYGYTPDDFRHFLTRDALDTIQVDATRCLGATGFLEAAAMVEAFHRPLSAHCAPLLHTHLCCHAQNAVHIEYFWDHARIEGMLFDGVPKVEDGYLTPQTERPGFGATFKEKDAEEFAL